MANPLRRLPTPEAWRTSTRPSADETLSPDLDVLYDRAIDAAFAKVKAQLFGREEKPN